MKTNSPIPALKEVKNVLLKTMCFLLLLCYGMAMGQIVNIPDANFKTRLITIGVDINADGQIQFTEAAAITNQLNVVGASISDLTGFEAFTNVSILKCTNNNLSTLNLSNLPNLKTIECGFNNNLSSLNLTNLVALDSLKTFNTNLSNLNVNNLTSLKYLDCSYNHITSLNVSNLTNLKDLNCASNSLNTIDVLLLTQLETLNCSMNQLTTISVAPLVNLKTLICSNNGINSLILSNLPSLEHLEYGNNQSTSLTFSNVPNMKYLDCSGNSIATLNASVLPLLQQLNCGGNNLITLNLSGLTQLSYLACSVNQLTTLNIGSLANLNYLNCLTNQLTSLNVTGLNNLNTLNASNNSIAIINLTNLPNLTSVNIDYNQLSSLDLTGSNNVTNLYCNNNQLTNLNITGLVNLNWLDCHNNQLTTVNFNGLTNLVNALCEHNLFTNLDFSGAPAFNNLGCGYNPNLTSINIKNGNLYINTNSYWVDTPNLAFVCADDEELSYVQQVLTQSLNTNAVINSYCSFTPGGNKNTITGTMLFDFNNNGCDANDLPQPNIRLNINDGTNSGATFTTNSGNYNFYTQVGSFVLTPDIENPTWFTFSPTTATIPFVNNNNNSTTQNFCIAPVGIHNDVEVVIEPITAARPGFDAVYKLVYKNKGNQTLSGAVGLTFNATVLGFVAATAVPSSQSSGNLQWNFTNLLPFENRSYYITMHVNAPTATPPVNIGDVLPFTATITPVATDETPLDNTITFNQTVVGAFDPNSIVCLEGAAVSPSQIGSFLHYGVNFENTGNYPAQNIVVKVVIDTTKYDVNTLQMLNTSNPAYTRINGNVIEFVFQNIMLDTGGHGDVLFKIKTLNSLSAGDVVSKRADIFFDYNAPIDTGMVNTTFQSLSNSSNQLDTTITVSPNPTSEIVNIKASTSIGNVQLFDVQGRLLQTSVGNATNATTLDLSERTSGVYFVKVISDKGTRVEKIVKN